MNSLLIFCQLSLSVVFTVSAVAKMREFEPFAEQLRTVAFAGARPFYWAVAFMVVVAEFLTVALLLVWPLIGFTFSVLLLAAFTAHLMRVISSGAQVSCGCTGMKSRTVVSGIQVVRNLILITIAVIGCALAESTTIDAQVKHLLLLGPSALIGLGILYLQEIKELMSDGLSP
ncbi:MauE/DoxX family redox-associated membrane protein [Streptomyces sp. NPDC044989]|uniref:MauE/DoxX family redox-associated membrane protein n=1 Tax=Streptomyces sp. NPDC044989 TaxID=3154336 RepID=UPI0033D644CB